MINNDSEKYTDLSFEHKNIIKENKIHVLPNIIQFHAVVDIFLTEKRTVTVESQYHPIRHGKHCGSRIQLGSIYGKIDYNPKLIWNGKEWLLNTFGAFVFSEIEFNTED